jgi:hypothetical protein
MASQGQTPEEIASDRKAFNDWQSMQSGYIGKKRKSNWWDQRNQTYRERRASNVLSGTPSGGILSGSTKEQEGQLAGLNTALMGYGQGLQQTGQDIQGVKKKLEDRVAQGGADPVSAAIMGQKQSAQAQARRGLAGTGARGTAMAGAIESIGKQKDQEIAASLYGQQRQSLQDYRGLLGNILGGTTGLMYGEKAANVQQPSLQQAGGGMLGTVICTELNRQGILSDEIYKKDAEYGASLPIEVVIGYHFWAIPVANKMSKSPLLTSLIKVPALKWAKHIAGEEKSIFGYACQYVGEAICAVIGKAVLLTVKEKVCTQK